MTKQDVINYVMKTPKNTNRAVLSAILDGYASEGGGSDDSILVGFIQRSLTSINIPDSVTSIGRYAFSGFKITSIAIPNSVTSIGYSAFGGCTDLTSITIPNSVTSIGDNAFSGDIGLTNIIIPNSVTSIGDSVFSGCSGLSNVTIPNSITSISYNLFGGCSGLTSITIPNPITSIESGAFSGCANLMNITCMASNPPSVSNWYSVFGGIPSNCKIYVPSESVDAYKAAKGWSTVASYIQAIEE